MSEQNFNRSADEKGKIPGWAAILVIILGLGVAGWWGWNAWHRAGTNGLKPVALDPASASPTAPNTQGRRANRQNNRGRRRLANQTGVHHFFGNQWIARDENILSSFDTNEKRINVAYTSYDMFPAGKQQMLNAWTRARYDEKVATQAGLSKADLQKLRSIPDPFNVTMTDDEQMRLVESWNQYIASSDAGKPAAEKSLLDTLKEIGAAHESYAKAQLSQPSLEAILTPEVVKKIEEAWRQNRRNRQNRMPRQRPAPAPGT